MSKSNSETGESRGGETSDWRKRAEQELRGAAKRYTSPGGMQYAPVYFKGSVAVDESSPGESPFTRGPWASMYQGKPWTVRQYAGFSTAEESNQFYKSCLAQGQMGLSVAFDLPTHRGYDSDHERARADAGKAGVAIDSVEDMVLLFQGIPLDRVSVSMTMNGAVAPILAAYVVAAEEQGVALNDLRGTIQNDILKEFLVRNTYIYPPEPSMRIVRDVMAYANEKLPRFNPVSVSGYHMKEAGATEELELALSLANGLSYVKQAVDAGLSVDTVAPRMSFFFGIGMDLFLEVAKLRAARRLWAKLITERFAPLHPDSARLRMHCQTSGVSLTPQDPLNNVVRTTIEALAAVLGGTQSLHTNAYDEALGLPTEDSARVARNTQLILQKETDVTHVVDPLFGSYLVEDLTNQLAEAAESILLDLEARGGMVKAIESGYAQKRIVRAAAERQARLDSGEERIVGVNCFQTDAESAIGVRVVDHQAVLEVQLERLEELRRKRNEPEVIRCLEVLRETARDSTQNLMPACVDCMRARATVGEVSLVLEELFGRYEPRAHSVLGVYGAMFDKDPNWEILQKRVLSFEQRVGRRPRILVAKIGQDGHDRGAKVVASGLADAGFDVDLGPLFQSPREVARAAFESDVHVIGISTQAGAHHALVSELFQQLSALGASHIQVVCGGVIPAQDHEALRSLGVAEIFTSGVTIYQAASRVLDVLSDAKL